MKTFSWILGLVLACQSSFGAEKETLSIGTSSEFETLHPVIGTQAALHYMMYMAWRAPVILGRDNKYKAVFIKTVPSIENKLAKKVGEGLEAKIEILEKVMWGDGTPLTCKDLEFTRKLGINKNVGIIERERYENIESITWEDKSPKKCTIKWKIAKFDFPMNLPLPLPAHIEESVFEKTKDTSEGYDRNTTYVKNPSNPGLYFGPYLISEVKLGSHVVLTPNPKFYGKAPQVKKIIFKLIPNGNTLEANLRSGVINVISPTGGLSLDQAVDLEKKLATENTDFKVLFEDSSIYAHIDLNMANPILADHKVRQALMIGFNKPEMIKTLLAGKAKEATQSVPDNDPWYSKNIKKYKYDRKAASKLLDEAGWILGKDGLRKKDGKKLSLTLMAASGAKINETLEAYLQNQYRQLGIEILIKNEPARVFFGETTQKRKFDMAFFSWGSHPENSPRTTMHSSMIPSDKNSWAGQNYTGYNNPKVDRWIEDLEKELNPTKRAALGRKIMEAYVEDIPVIPMYFRQANVVIPKGLKNYFISAHQFYESNYVEDWTF